MKMGKSRSKVGIGRKSADWGPYDYALPIVQDRLARGDFPPPEALAAILEFNQDRLLPQWLLQHVVGRLRGQIKLKRGQRRQSEWRKQFTALANWDYRRHLDWLARREKSQGLKGWSALQGKFWWQGPPHERALAIVHELYRRDMEEFRSIGLARFRNLLSSGR